MSVRLVGMIAALAAQTVIAAEAPAFADIAKVLRHPRCLNCHTLTDFPRQGDDRHRHLFRVVRGTDDHGAAAMRCATCHRDANNEVAGIPGAPRWSVAPLSMGWEGLDDAALCRRLKDRSRNGNRDVAALIEHMANDPLVAWGWSPGAARTPVAMPKAEFVDRLERWAAAGAPCP